MIICKCKAERDKNFGPLKIIAKGTGTDDNAVLNLQMQVAEKAAAALMGKYGTSYKVGSTSLILCKCLYVSLWLFCFSKKRVILVSQASVSTVLLNFLFE